MEIEENIEINNKRKAENALEIVNKLPRIETLQLGLSNLPNELLQMIFSFCDNKTLLQLSSACTQFRSIGNAVFKTRLREYFGLNISQNSQKKNAYSAIIGELAAKSSINLEKITIDSGLIFFGQYKLALQRIANNIVNFCLSASVLDEEDDDTSNYYYEVTYTETEVVEGEWRSENKTFASQGSGDLRRFYRKFMDKQCRNVDIVDVANYLLTKITTDINSTANNPTLTTMTHFIFSTCNEEAIKLFLDKGADIELENFEQQTAVEVMLGTLTRTFRELFEPHTKEPLLGIAKLIASLPKRSLFELLLSRLSKSHIDRDDIKCTLNDDLISDILLKPFLINNLSGCNANCTIDELVKILGDANKLQNFFFVIDYVAKRYREECMDELIEKRDKEIYQALRKAFQQQYSKYPLDGAANVPESVTVSRLIL